jgi:Rod binding domain-containing protein
MTTPSTSSSIYSKTDGLLPRPHTKIALDPHDPLTKQTQKLVAQTFFGTMLKQMRQSPFHNDMFEGGHGGAAFNELLDQHLADHMTRGAGSKLVHSFVRKFQAIQAYKKQTEKHSDPMSVFKVPSKA